MTMNINTQEIIELLAPYTHALPLSYSKINTLLACPRMYQKRYIEKIKIELPPKDVIIVGKFVHKVLELCLNRGQTYGWEPGAIDFDMTWMQVSRQCKLPIEEFNMAQGIRISTEKTFLRVADAIRKNRFIIFPELMLCVDKQGVVKPGVRWPNRFFWGFIDFYAETQSRKRAVMLDFKSHGKTEDHVKKAHAQLSTYAYYLFERNPALESIQFGGAYLPDEDIDLSSQIYRDSPEHAAVVEHVYNLYQQFAAALNTGDFSPKISEYCDWCEHTHGCPAYP